MARKINCKINVMKINKAKLFKGDKGTYLDFTLIETPGGRYGDWMVVQDNKKGDQGQNTILGNGKNFGWSDSGSSKPKQNNPPSAADLGI